MRFLDRAFLVMLPIAALKIQKKSFCVGNMEEWHFLADGLVGDATEVGPRRSDDASVSLGLLIYGMSVNCVAIIAATGGSIGTGLHEPLLQLGNALDGTIVGRGIDRDWATDMRDNGATTF